MKVGAGSKPAST